MAKLQRWKVDQWLPVVRIGQGLTINGSTRDTLCVIESFFYPDYVANCTNPHMLEMCTKEK